MRILIACSFAALLSACASAPSQAPDELAVSLVADLEAGDRSAASKRFKPVADNEEYRELIYPVLFDAARASYEAGNGESAVSLLRFLVDKYPAAQGAREAFLYALFLERGSVLEADEATNEEIQEQLDALREEGATPPNFVRLVAAQAAIDRGDMGAARSELDQFLAAWDGQPARLLPYVEDLTRYISLQGGQ